MPEKVYLCRLKNGRVRNCQRFCETEIKINEHIINHSVCCYSEIITMDKKTQITETGSHIDILAGKIEKLIQDARQHVVAAVNTAMVYTYYEIGRYIVEDEQGGENRAIYGQELLKGLSNRLTHRLGKGWSVENLTLMRKFFITYSNPIEEKTENENSKQCLRNFQLSWSHYLKLMRITNLEERNFYEIEAIQNNWSLRELERQYDSSLYERLSLSRDKENSVVEYTLPLNNNQIFAAKYEMVLPSKEELKKLISNK